MSYLITIVMPTAKRPQGVDYLSHTLAELSASGVFESEHLDKFTVSRDRIRTPHLNVVECLLSGYKQNRSKWILFLEDDIDVCGDFLGSVARWLEDHSNDCTLIYTFGCTNPAAGNLHESGIFHFEYPASEFYGTQAFAIDRLRIPGLVDHLQTSTRSSGTYDLMIADWGRLLQGPECRFLASSPSFVQHIGECSGIRPESRAAGAIAHKFDSFSGHEWVYGGGGRK